MSVPANSMPSAPVIEVRGVHTRFGSAVVHRGIDFDVNAGDILGMVGGSGSGKTTLLREIVGLLRPTEGAVRLFGHPVLDPDPVIRRSVRRRFGMLFQKVRCSPRFRSSTTSRSRCASYASSTRR